MKGQSQCWAILTCWVLNFSLVLRKLGSYFKPDLILQVSLPRFHIGQWVVVHPHLSHNGFPMDDAWYVLGHITPQQHVLFSLWNLYNKLRLATQESWIGARFLPFELVGFICVFFGLLVFMVFPRIACSLIWIGHFRCIHVQFMCFD